MNKYEINFIVKSSDVDSVTTIAGWMHSLIEKSDINIEFVSSSVGNHVAEIMDDDFQRPVLAEFGKHSSHRPTDSPAVDVTMEDDF